jgi:hypothetical protein
MDVEAEWPFGFFGEFLNDCRELQFRAIARLRRWALMLMALIPSTKVLGYFRMSL